MVLGGGLWSAQCNDTCMSGVGRSRLRAWGLGMRRGEGTGGLFGYGLGMGG